MHNSYINKSNYFIMHMYSHTHKHYCVRKAIDAFIQQGCIKLIKKVTVYICELLDFLFIKES